MPYLLLSPQFFVGALSPSLGRSKLVDGLGSQDGAR
jgi:hypothetical protein